MGGIRTRVGLGMLVVLAWGGSGHADGEVALDAAKRREHHYSGKLTGSATVRSLVLTGDSRPTPQACEPDTCVVTNLRLTLPQGVDQGRLELLITSPATNAGFTVSLYTAAGSPVTEVNETRVGGLSVGGTGPQTRARFTIANLASGRYSVYVFSKAGYASFQAALSWQAND